ncbi:MAG: hypothetical protein U0T82_14425 [Bacteroidales bacterium]
MGKKEEYIELLNKLEKWDDFLLKNSNLPGPRANLELLYAVAACGKEKDFIRWIQLDGTVAPTGDPREFLAACGTAGLGRLLDEKRQDLWNLLEKQACDPRWRVREATAMALQLFGDRDMDLLLRYMELWVKENLLVNRAVMAALCEPRLLKKKENAMKVLDITERITHSLIPVKNRKSEEFRVLRQALGYGWSVAVAACPAEGMKRFNNLEKLNDKDIDWIIRENRNKNRMKKLQSSKS